METKSKVSVYWTTIGKKFFMGVTGLLLVGFIVVHLLGNLTMFSSDPNLLNLYAHKLESLGPGLYVVEAILALFFIIHIFFGISVKLQNWKARPQGYSVKNTGDGPTRVTISSKTMIYTGLIIGIFTVFHLISLKFGPHISDGYFVTINGEQIRNLHLLVVERFHELWYTVLYVAVMILLGYHLRHGFWSAFQSLGATNPKYSNLIYCIGVVLAIVLALGFVVIPIYIHVALDPASITY